MPKRGHVMSSPGVFICHDLDTKAHQELQILTRLRQRLEETGTTVTVYPGRASDDGFLPFLNQTLPDLQWFILFQTPAAAQSYQVRMAVNTALKLLEQRRLQGVVRFLASADGSPVEMPAEWTSLPTFDGSYDYPRAIEKLVLTLEQDRAPLPVSASPQAVQALLPTPSLGSSPASTPSTPTSLRSPGQADYDRPVLPPNRLVPFGGSFRDFDFGTTERGRAIIGLSFLLVATLVLGTVMALLLTHPSQTPAGSTIISYGHLQFFNTGLTGADNTTGICDGLDIHLQNLGTPQNGQSFYAWLLRDKSQLGGALLLSKFTPVHGRLDLRYTSPNHQNLLASYSRFLITEESASLTPDSPTADLTRWRYYAEIPQVPDPQAETVGNTTVHYSNLDHLRHLLSGEPQLDQLSLHGGLSVWFFENVSKIFEWASTARGTGVPRDATEMHNALVKILDYLDGTELVAQDVPRGTPILVDPTVGRVPLLTLDEKALPVPGYIRHIELDLIALTSSPHSSAAQRQLAGQIDAELNRVKANLDQVRQDARQLVNMSPKQLLASSTFPLLDDLLSQARTAFIGEVNPATGVRSGGAVWIFDHMPELAALNVTPYKT
ncbi:hypothetical protein [Thermogemmatispora sp.]|uniref:hypothetical protein n=1 Tax=Thermogemmatispora sp. TaxID=1968838 RepID=UPI001D30AFF8|nr:hypothetical protein [Thermogemmatispora sp.]MBX5450587.1 hypothetical protein [Thermogemmatispora sp.]